MTMRRKTITSVGVAAVMIVAALLSAGCISEDEDEFDGTIRVGWLTGDIHQVAYFVAQNDDAGGGTSFFDQYDVKVKNAQVGGYLNGPTEMDHFGKGEVDIGYLGSPPAITKHINGGVKTKVIASVNAIGSAIVVREGIDTAEDLKGKTILTPGVGTIQHFLLLTYLENNNIQTSELESIEAGVAPTLMLQRLDEDKADGFIAWEPFCAEAVTTGKGEILVYSHEIWEDHICCVVAVDQSFGEKHSEHVVNFLKAHIAASNWINQALEDDTSADYALLVNISKDFTQRDEATVKAALDNMRYSWDITPVFENFFTAFIEKLIDQEIIEQDDLNDRGYSSASDVTAKYIDKSYITEAKAG